MELTGLQVVHCVYLLLLMSVVKSGGEGNCKFDNEEGKDGEGNFRIFPGKNQGLVEFRCNKEDDWGTFSASEVRDNPNVPVLICRKLGYGDGSQLEIELPQADDVREGGYGPVWQVVCDDTDTQIENCTFTQTKEEEFYSFGTPPKPYWDHGDDLYVRCGRREVYSFESETEHIVTFVIIDVATFFVLLGLIVLSGFIVYHLLLRKFKSEHRTISTSQATSSV